MTQDALLIHDFYYGIDYKGNVLTTQKIERGINQFLLCKNDDGTPNATTSRVISRQEILDWMTSHQSSSSKTDADDVGFAMYPQHYGNPDFNIWKHIDSGTLLAGFSLEMSIDQDTPNAVNAHGTITHDKDGRFYPKATLPCLKPIVASQRSQ